MKNFKFESYPEKLQNLILDFDERIKKIEESFKNNKTSIKIEDLLNIKDGENAKHNLKLIGFEPKTLKEFQGAYIFYDPKLKKIVYVGISRKLIQRLRQHVNHKDPNTASLAYLMAKNEVAKKKGWNKPEDWHVKKGYWKNTKANFKNSKKFREQYQNKIKEYKITFLEFSDNFEMALFEVYAAMKCEAYWNSFRTH